MQYFARVPCPVDVFIPTEDSDAWLWNPAHRWIYDKLAVATSQGLDAAPHGVSPTHYPVFSKPIYNLKGMGVGSRRLLRGGLRRRVSTWSFRGQPCSKATMSAVTCVVIDGEPKWWSHARPYRRRGHLRLLGDRLRDAEPGDRGLDRRLVPQAPARLHRHGQPRRRSAPASSKAICASPTNGPISMAAIPGSKRVVRLYARGECVVRRTGDLLRTGYSAVLFLAAWAALPTPIAIAGRRRSPQC